MYLSHLGTLLKYGSGMKVGLGISKFPGKANATKVQTTL